MSITSSDTITLTDSATAKVAELIAQEGNPALALRVAVRPGGCSGFSYEMFFDTDIASDDLESSYVDAADTGNAADPHLDVLGELGPQRAAGGGEGDAHLDLAVVLDVDPAHHAEVDDVVAQLGIDHAEERAADGFLTRSVRSVRGGLGARRFGRHR